MVHAQTVAAFAHSKARFTVVLGLAAVLLVPMPVAAQSGATGGAGDEAAAAGSTPMTPAEGRRTRDASSDRGLLFPVAETIPEHYFEITDYELFLLTLAYGATDRLQISLTTILPIVEDQPYFVWLTGKYAAYRSDTLVFSPLLSLDISTASGDTIVSAAVGALLDVILGDRGQGAVSFGLLSFFPLSVSDSIDSDLDLFDDVALVLNGSFTWEVARIVKLVIEVDLPAAIVNGEFDVAEGVLINYGVRFFNDTLAGDIAFVRPVGNTGDDPFILGFPLATFTARF